MKDGSQFLLEGKDLSIVLKTPYGKQEILDYSINGNVIEWTFLGKDQKFLGKYSLILVVNKNSEGMVTTDACNFVELVACSCEANGADDAGVQTESVDLVSKVDIGGNGGGSYDDSELRDAIESLEQIKANKPILISIEALGTPAHQAEDDTMYWTPEQVEAALSMTLSELYEQAQTIEVIVDIMGQTLYPESAVRYEDDSIEFRYPISLPAVSGFYVLAIRRSPKDLEGVKAAIILGGQLEEIATKSELTELSAEMGKKVDADKVATINGQSLVNGGDITIEGGKGEKGDKGDKGDQGNSGYTGAADELEVVNNLTQGGATAALSAEMGKLIGDVLDINPITETKTYALEEGVDYTSTEGYALGTGEGEPNANANFRRTSFIVMKAGDKIEVSASAPNSVAIIAQRVNGTSRTIPLVVGEGWNKMVDVSYSADKDCEVMVSWQVNNNMTLGGIVLTATRQFTRSETINEIQENVSTLTSKADEAYVGANKSLESIISEKIDDANDGIVSGKYVNHDGNIVTNSSFSYKEYNVKKGDEISIEAIGHPNVSALARKIGESINSVYFSKLVPYTSTDKLNIAFVADRNMTIAVSFNNTQPREITITTNKVQYASFVVDDVLKGQNTYKQSLMMDINYGMMFSKIAVIGDSLSSGRVEGIEGQTDAVGADFYNYSWLAHLARLWGNIPFKNYSNGGATTASWLSQWLPIMQEDSEIYDAYFIALGTNNEYNETSPTTDAERYAAFKARYNEIIDKVREKAPNAAIFLVSLYEPRLGVGNSTLEEIAAERMQNDEGIYYIDYFNNASFFRYSQEVNWRGHYGSVGYVYVASVINSLVNDIIWSNQLRQFWIQFAKYHNF